jgi:hypothetical protein
MRSKHPALDAAQVGDRHYYGKHCKHHPRLGGLRLVEGNQCPFCQREYYQRRINIAKAEIAKIDRILETVEALENWF